MVSITRSKHGWFDGSVSGKIIEMTDSYCVVLDAEGCKHEIRHPRDISRNL